MNLRRRLLRKSQKKMNRQYGYSLSELLFANCIALFLCGLMFLFYHNVRNYITDYSALIQQQQTIRLLHTWFKTKIAQAGYMGCLQLPLRNGMNIPFTGITILRDHAQQLKLMNHSLNDNITSDSDLLMIQYMEPVSVAPQHIQANNEIVLTQTPIFSIDEQLIINDCMHAEFIAIKSIRKNKHAQLITLKDPLQHIYQHNIQIGRFITEVYFIAATKRQNRAGQPILALYRLLKNPKYIIAEELLDGIDRMQITYSLTKIHAEFFNKCTLCKCQVKSLPKEIGFYCKQQKFLICGNKKVLFY